MNFVNYSYTFKSDSDVLSHTDNLTDLDSVAASDTTAAQSTGRNIVRTAINTLQTYAQNTIELARRNGCSTCVQAKCGR